MIIQEPGKICEGLYLLGRTESNVYILDGKEDMALIGGGMIYIAKDVKDQIESFGLDPKKITKAIILHSHFDHVGIFPYLKKKWPWMKILGSNKAKELLSSEKVLESIRFMNDIILERQNFKEKAKELGIDFLELPVDEVLKEGDVVEVGCYSLQVLEVPGHSSCSIALYEPNLKALFASDAGGIPAGENVFTAANSNFDKYLDSLNKMAKLDVKIHLAEHFGALTEEDAKNFMQKSLESAKLTRKVLEDIYKETKDISMAQQKATKLIMEQLEKEFLPEEVIAIVVGQMIKYLAKQLN